MLHPPRNEDAERNDLDEIREGLAAGMEGLARDLLGKETARQGAEYRYGKHGSLSVMVRGAKRGQWFDHEAQEGGDALALIRRERGGNFAQALDFARRFLGMPERGKRHDDRAYQEARRQEREAKKAADEKEAAQEAATRIARARRFASEGTAIDGTPAAQYLARRAIPRPATGWPSTVRYHAGRNALLLIATNEAGDVQAVQFVHLTAEGTKRPEEEGRPTKQSYGLLSGATVRLPGMGGPLLLAEGPETGLTVWAATGRETWVALGSIAKIAPPPLRQLVVCADDDPRDAPAAKVLQKAVATWRGEARNVLLALPWERRRFDKSDHNDVAQRDGAEAVRTRIEAAIAPRANPNARLPIDLARLRAQKAIEGFFAQAREHDLEDHAGRPVHGVRVDVGIGKSASARDEAASYLAGLRRKGDTRNVAILVPTHKLGDEQARAFEELPEAKAAGLRAAVWRGRNAPDPSAPGKTMCLDLEATIDAQKVGANVEQSVCRKGDTRCPFFDVCGYQAQKQRTADLWIGAHELLFTETPRAFGKIAALVVDEAAWPKGLEGTTGHPADVTLDAFADDVTIPDGEGMDTDRIRFVHNLARRTLAELPDGPVRRADLIAAGITSETVKDGHQLSWRRVVDPGIKPGMDAGERRSAVRAVAGNRTAMRLARVFKAMEALIDADGPEASGWLSLATVDGDNGPVRVLRVRGRRDVRKGWLRPTLVLDALLDPDLLRPYWPTIRVTARIEASTPHMRVRQLIGRDWSKSALVPAPYNTPAENERRLSNSSRLRAAVMREARKAMPGNVLVVAQKDVEDHWRQLGPLPRNVEIAHHNAVAGRNDWQDVRLLVVVGRTLPRPGDVERIAEALTGAAVTARLSGRYERRDCPIEMEDGSAATTEADWHPDPTAEAVRWQICEGELLQIIGRGRGVNRTAATPLDVLVLTDRPLPLPIAETVTMDDLKALPADLMMDRAGVALADAADASLAFPDLFGTPEAARKTFSRARCGTIPNRDIFNGECPAPLRRITYQRAGAGRRPASAVVDTDLVPDPRAWLEDRLGPLAAYTEPDPPSPEAAPRPPPEAEPPDWEDADAEPPSAEPPQLRLPPATWLRKVTAWGAGAAPIEILMTAGTRLGPVEISGAALLPPNGAPLRGAWFYRPPPGGAFAPWPTSAEAENPPSGLS